MKKRSLKKILVYTCLFLPLIIWTVYDPYSYGPISLVALVICIGLYRSIKRRVEKRALNLKKILVYTCVYTSIFSGLIAWAVCDPSGPGYEVTMVFVFCLGAYYGAKKGMQREKNVQKKRSKDE